MESRKDLLMKADTPKRQEPMDAKKLSEIVDKAAAFAAMRETRGWKILHKEFIEPRISLDRIFQARGPFKRAEEVAAVKELDLLMRTVMGTIEEGQRANDKLEDLRKN